MFFIIRLNDNSDKTEIGWSLSHLKMGQFVKTMVSPVRWLVFLVSASTDDKLRLGDDIIKGVNQLKHFGIRTSNTFIYIYI